MALFIFGKQHNPKVNTVLTHSFPPRRSSDIEKKKKKKKTAALGAPSFEWPTSHRQTNTASGHVWKSKRLNSSHVIPPLTPSSAGKKKNYDTFPST